MFHFGKKTKENGVAEEVTGGGKSSSKSSKPFSRSSKSDKSSDPPLSKDEIQRLEDTKNKLFGSMNKKPKSTLDTSSPENGSSGVKISPPKPKPPPRPPKLRDSPLPPDPNPAPPPIPRSPPKNAPAMLPSSIRINHPHSSPSQSSTGSLTTPMSPDNFGGFGFHPLKTFNLPGVNLPSLKPTSIVERTISFTRLPTGEFGFSLRRAQIVIRRPDNTEERKTVLFAEPLVSDRLANTDAASKLMPGDELLGVNGQRTEHLNRDEVIQLIRDSGDYVTLTVKAIPEISELTGTRQGTGPGDEAGSETPNFTRSRSKRWKPPVLGAVGMGAEARKEPVWLNHKDGYSGALLLGPGNIDGTVRIKLEGSGNEIQVDSDDIEKANPPELDRAEDLGQLMFLNESSALHLLRQRFGSNLVHTYAGSSSTIIINPVFPLSIYSEKVVQMFRGCKRDEMPPHIYSVAQQVFRNMQSSRKNQAVVFTGRSGSGKTTQARHLLQYLCQAAGSVGNLLTTQKLNAICGLMEAFGNCRTRLNQNASRFATVITIDFDHMSQMSAGIVQGLLLESHRVVHVPEASGEANFHVFYYLWEGCSEQMRKDLFLDQIDDPSSIISPLKKSVEKETARLGWNKLQASLEYLGVTPEERSAIWCAVAAIFHLGHAGANRGVPSFKSQFLRPTSAQKAATLLGIDFQELHKTVFMSQHQEEQRQKQERTSTSNMRRGPEKSKLSFRASLEKLSITDKVGDGGETLDAFIVGLYKETFNLIISLINRALTSNYRTLTSITVVDCPGFQNPASVPNSKGAPRPGTFSDFCFNYINERLNLLFFNANFTAQMELYRQEQIEVDVEAPNNSPRPLVEILDKPSQQELIKSTNIELRSQEKRGMLWLLDEESIFPGATDESFMERLFVHYGDQKDGLLKKSKHYNHFVVRHSMGTNPVTYSASSWLKRAQENPVTRAVLPLLQDSQKGDLSTLFLSLRSGGLPGVSALDTGSSARRTTMVYKTLNNPQAIKRKSYPIMVKLQMDCIVEMVRRVGRSHFVHCMLPQPEAGTGAVERFGLSEDVDSSLVNVPLLRSQIRGLQLLDSVRLNKIGFPERMMFREFKRRYECLIPTDAVSPKDILDDKQGVQRLMKTLEVDESQFRLGLSQVFMRSDLLSQLEERRDERLSSIVIKIQSVCRGFVARKLLEKKKIQVLAVKCIQKNINKLMGVRTWPWWRLYTRVLPLLDVHRTDEELKNQGEEIEALRSKNERLEKQLADLKLMCNRLEARLADSQSELSEERVTTTQASEALEGENTTRLRVEKEYAELKNKHAALEKRAQRLELEAVEYRNLKSALPEDDESEEGMSEKYQELKRQIEAQKRELNHEKQDAAARITEIKKTADKKVQDAQREIETMNDTVSSQKRKAQHAVEELQDVRLHVQQLSARNSELERKQRKFDIELKHAKEAEDIERIQKERYVKEKEETMSKVYRLEQELKDAREEASRLGENSRRQERELQELSESASGQTEQIDTVQQKRKAQELELKCKDQEEELDELAGNVQQLQANVTRLEMQAERSRQVHQKELDSKEQELEETKTQMQRRLRSMEQQLEDEYEEKSSLQKNVRDLEAKLRAASDYQVIRDDSGEQQLKRDLKKTKALLKDAQTMLQHYKDNAPNRGMLKQLKNQLEDAEFSRISAVKVKQALEGDLGELRGQLEIAMAGKAAAEDRCLQLMKEKSNLLSQLDDHEEELQQLLKKYKAQVQQGSVDQITLKDQIVQIGELEKTKEKLQEKLTEAESRCQWQESYQVDKHKLQLAETKIRDLEAKLELELSVKQRLEINVSKIKESVEGLQGELANLRAAKDREQDLNRRMQTQLQQSQDILTDTQKRDAESAQKNHDLEAAIERGEQEHQATLADLKLALRRIDDLQAALQEDLELDMIEFDEEDEDDEEDLEEEEGLLYYPNGRFGAKSPLGGDTSNSNFTSPLPRSLSGSSVDPKRAESGSSECSAPIPITTSTPAHI